MIGHHRRYPEYRRSDRPARVWARWVVVALALLDLSVPPPVAADPMTSTSSQGSPSSPVSAATTDLSGAVPADVSLYFHARLPDDSAPGAATVVFDAMKKALSAASFIPPFAGYLDEVVLAKRRSALDTELEYWRKLLEEHAWWRLFRREFVLAGRLEFEVGEPDLEVYRRGWLMGFSVAPDERDLFLGALGDLLEGLGAIVPASELDVGRRDGSVVTCLYSLFDPSLEFCVAGRDGLVLLSTSRSLLRQSMQLLSGESSDLSFALNRLGELQKKEASSSSHRSSVAWLSSQSRFLKAALGGGKDTVAGFELMVRPMGLFADLLRDDPLLVDWKTLNVAGDFRDGAIQCYFDTDLPAGKEELERVLDRALIEPIERLHLGPVLYREIGAVLPRADDDLEPPEVTVLLREVARWLKGAVAVLDPGGRRLTAASVRDAAGAKRLRGEATLPLVVRESASKR